MRAPRKPRLEFFRAPRGFCTFCGGEIIEPDGERSRRKNWHPGCVTVWHMATNANGCARAYIWRRAGWRCEACGVGLVRFEPGAVLDPAAEAEGHYRFPRWRYPDADGPFTTLREIVAAWQMDHKIPLWLFNGEAPLWAFLPANLWCLCDGCHKAKTAREAAQRAADRRRRR